MIPASVAERFAEKAIPLTETGCYAATVETLSGIAHALGVTVGALLGSVAS